MPLRRLPQQVESVRARLPLRVPGIVASYRLLLVHRMIRAVLVGAALVCAVVVVVVVGVLAYHSAAAGRAQDAPAEAAVTAAFEEAETRWRSHIDWPVHRLVLTSAEEYGTGIYLFVFDVYSWFGIGSGYVTHCPEPDGADVRVTACSGGGIVRDGGFAGIGERVSAEGLLETRAEWTRAYGSGRVVAPTVR